MPLTAVSHQVLTHPRETEVRSLHLAYFALCLVMPAHAESPLTQSALTGTWVEKAGEATYVFGDGYNFEYRRSPHPRLSGDVGTIQKGIWRLASDICSVGSSKGNLYVQAGTERCCHSAYFLGNNLVLTAIPEPMQALNVVCSDRVLVRQAP